MGGGRNVGSLSSLAHHTNIRARQKRSGEGVVWRNGCPKGLFWRVRFFLLCPIRFALKAPESLRNNVENFFAVHFRVLDDLFSARRLLRSLAHTQNSMPNMTGRPGSRTMEMIGGSSVSYLARTPCVPFVSTLFNRGGNRRTFRLPGESGDHFHRTVEPSPGHIWCRKTEDSVYLRGAGCFLEESYLEESALCWRVPHPWCHQGVLSACCGSQIYYPRKIIHLN